MLPEFFHIGQFAVRAYGLTLALSFLIGLSLIHREAKVVGVDPNRMVSLGYILIVFGVLGGRLGYVLYHLEDFVSQPLEIINPFHSSGPFGIAGLNLQGGLIGGLAAGLVYLARHRIPVASAFDSIVPAVGFGIFLTRIGCYLNGCCFGTPTTCFLGVHFPPEAAATAVFGSQAVHPTQLYSSAYGLLLFVGLRWVNRHRYRAGLSVGLFFMVEALFRFLIEPLRYYESQMWFELAGMRVTYNQLAACILFAVGAYFVFRPGVRQGKTA